VSDELHQSFISGRNASVVDVGIDIVSGVFAKIISPKLLYEFQLL
jgi:VanZ family protein